MAIDRCREQSIDRHRYMEVLMLLGESSFPHLREAEEARLMAELERRRVALERSPRPAHPLRERLARVLASSKRRVAHSSTAS
jgi:hypothetical protein